MRRPLFLAVLLSVLLPASAGAAVVEVRRTETTFPTHIKTVNVVFEAAAGEVNRLAVRTDGGDFLFTDAGAQLSAGEGCRTEGAAVRCSASDATGVEVLLADGADSVDGAAYSGSAHLTLNGGAGDDVLAASENRDTLLGGRGEDAMSGRGGDDMLFGEELGAAGPDAGADRLDGGAGDDTLLGGTGADVLLGRDGDDQLDLAHDGDDRRVACGPGSDRVFAPSAAELLRACERAAFTGAGALIGLPPRRVGRLLRVRFDCVAEDPAVCRGGVSAGGRTVAFSNRTGRPVTLRVPLPRRTGRQVVISVSGTARYRRCEQCTTVRARISGRVRVLTRR